MIGVRAVAAALGVVFGFLLAWSTMADPDAIRRMLLLDDAYLYLVFALSVGTAFVGTRLLRRARVQALVTREPVAWEATRLAPRHVVGSVVFGTGWAISASCPGPIAAQLGQGIFWSLCTIVGIGIGIVAYLRLQQRREAAAPDAPTAALPS